MPREFSTHKIHNEICSGSDNYSTFQRGMYLLKINHSGSTTISCNISRLPTRSILNMAHASSLLGQPLTELCASLGALSTSNRKWHNNFELTTINNGYSSMDLQNLPVDRHLGPIDLVKLFSSPFALDVLIRGNRQAYLASGFPVKYSIGDVRRTNF